MGHAVLLTCPVDRLPAAFISISASGLHFLNRQNAPSRAKIFRGAHLSRYHHSNLGSTLLLFLLTRFYENGWRPGSRVAQVASRKHRRLESETTLEYTNTLNPSSKGLQKCRLCDALLPFITTETNTAANFRQPTTPMLASTCLLLATSSCHSESFP